MRYNSLCPGLPLFLKAAAAGPQGQRQQYLRGASPQQSHKLSSRPAGCQCHSGTVDNGLVACSGESPIVYTVPKKGRKASLRKARSKAAAS